MSPHYDRHADNSAEQNDFETTPTGAIDDTAAEEAAAALREADIESAQEESQPLSIDSSTLDTMTIDELRVVAKQLDVPDREKITEQDELIAAIRRSL